MRQHPGLGKLSIGAQQVGRHHLMEASVPARPHDVDLTEGVSELGEGSTRDEDGDMRRKPKDRGGRVDGGNVMHDTGKKKEWEKA